MLVIAVDQKQTPTNPPRFFKKARRIRKPPLHLHFLFLFSLEIPRRSDDQVAPTLSLTHMVHSQHSFLSMYILLLLCLLEFTLYAICDMYIHKYMTVESLFLFILIIIITDIHKFF